VYKDNLYRFLVGRLFRASSIFVEAILDFLASGWLGRFRMGAVGIVATCPRSANAEAKLKCAINKAVELKISRTWALSMILRMAMYTMKRRRQLF